MTTGFSYRLSDFILFSERVYWRLFEQINTLAGWFLPVLIALGCLLLGVWSRYRAVQNTAALVLAAFWVNSAFLFLLRYYTSVNWAAGYAVPFFFAEAGLIAVLGLTGLMTRPLPGNDARSRIGMGILAYAIVIHPFTSLLFGRPLSSAEIVGLAPDATAIATLGLLLITARPIALWLLLPIPVTVCILSGLTLYTLGTAEAWIMPIVLFMTAIGLVLPEVRSAPQNNPDS